MTYLPWGLYYSYDHSFIPLPLLRVRAAASIKELAAEVKLTHTYANDTKLVLQASYSFPIPAQAVVLSFIMIKQDGTRVIGHVEGTAEAKVIYQSAVIQGQQAALMEQQTPDVFQLAVGNIQAGETVQIELVYATVLSEDEENDSVRFHLPVHVGARYGQAPAHHWQTQDYAWYFTGPSWPFLEISVTVEAVAPIAKISCPSHSVSTELGPDPTLPNSHELPFSNYARVSLSSEAALDKDFVLTVKSAGLDAPRCVAELHPIHPTVALALTVVPRFKLPDLSCQEFVFLIDRSGSMRGPRIEAAKRALVVMLRSLPANDTMFQIASFGNMCTMLWENGSRPYNQATLDDATQHVDEIKADYGGTKIREALAHCFMMRKTDRPTSVFLLTDGAAWDVDGVLNEVKAAVAGCSAQAYLRVSVLGIGNTGSTAMCQGIARVGNGTSMLVGDHETSFTGKIARMLKAARTPLISDITVDWGVSVVDPPDVDSNDDDFVLVSDDEGKDKGKGKGKMSFDMFDESVDPLQMNMQPVPPPPEVVLSPPAQVQQSPFKIQTLSPGNRLNVWAIVQGKTLPKTVTLTGSTEDGSEIRLLVPVTLSNLPNAPESPPALHALAARKIIQDLEDGQHAIADSNPEDPDLLARTVRASIVRLGKLYSIASSQTSFVAVDESGALNSVRTVLVQPEARPSPAEIWKSITYKSMSHVYPGPASEPLFAQRVGVDRDRERDDPDRPRVIQASCKRRRSAAPPNGAAAMVSLLGTKFGASTEQTTSHASRPVLMHCDDAASKETQYLRRKCSNCQTSSPPSWRRSLSDPTKILCNKCGLSERSMSGRGLKRSNLRSQRGVSAAATGPTRPNESPARPTAMDIVEALARLQSFDGRFSSAVISTLQLNVPADQARAAFRDISDEVFATVIAMTFFCTKLGPDVERESWEAMYDKARTFVEDTLQNAGVSVGVDELQTKAMALLV
ncbi:von Willebrand factor type A domain-containing protein [Mycena epipterygia]|nr:von Willebrand factor type A domain-containing protein [Mycena epipterygia]